MAAVAVVAFRELMIIEVEVTEPAFSVGVTSESELMALAVSAPVSIAVDLMVPLELMLLAVSVPDNSGCQSARTWPRDFPCSTMT